MVWSRWKIDCPIQKRDRKSGARKRSQQETERERLTFDLGTARAAAC